MTSSILAEVDKALGDDIDEARTDALDLYRQSLKMSKGGKSKRAPTST